MFHILVHGPPNHLSGVCFGRLLKGYPLPVGTSYPCAVSRFAGCRNIEACWSVPQREGSHTRELAAWSQTLWKAPSSEKGRLETNLTLRHRKVKDLIVTWAPSGTLKFCTQEPTLTGVSSLKSHQAKILT